MIKYFLQLASQFHRQFEKSTTIEPLYQKVVSVFKSDKNITDQNASSLVESLKAFSEALANEFENQKDPQFVAFICLAKLLTIDAAIKHSAQLFDVYRKSFSLDPSFSDSLFEVQLRAGTELTAAFMSYLETLRNIEIQHQFVLEKDLKLQEYTRQCIAAFEEGYLAILNFYRKSTPMTLRLLATDFNEIIASKNQRHQKLGGPFSGMVLYPEKVSTLAFIDQSLFERLLHEVKSIAWKKKSRTQFMFYCNSTSSHCIGVDVGLEDNILHIVLYESSRVRMCYELLEKLKPALGELGVPFRVGACVTNLQSTRINCDVFAYKLIGESAKHSLSSQFLVASMKQPSFNDFCNGTKEEPLLNGVHWIDFSALNWPKVLLLKQSYNKLDRDIPQLIQNFGELRLGDNPTLLSANDALTTHKKKFQSEEGHNMMADKKMRSLYQRFVNKKQPPREDLKQIRQHYAVPNKPLPDAGQALRRAAAGYGSKQLMQRFIDCLSRDFRDTLDAQDKTETSKRTPLHWALQNGNAMRAAMLVNAGARIDIEDASKNKDTAATLFKKSQVPAIKENPVLKRKFK